MKQPSFIMLAILVITCLLTAVTGLYVLSNFKSIFRRVIRNELLRQNVVVWLVVFCFSIAITPINNEALTLYFIKGPCYVIIAQMIVTTVNVLFIFNIVRLVVQSRALRKLSFVRQRVIILVVLIITTVVFDLPLNFLANDFSTKNMKYSILWCIYLASITGLVYIMMSYLDAERSRKLQAKELELSKMNELKTKAELDTLHSKVNPHFLYNALNSIADLSITDGKKARKMTIALADLFRYNINYSHNNYSTVSEEVAMTEVYLQIEKIRFEDQLNYTVSVDEEAGHYLIPRFILQPLAENAVKHGLKVTGRLTEIKLEIKMLQTGLLLVLQDNGPVFPDELVPGYGVKSVYDKMDLLFPGLYEIHFTNLPHKQVAIHIFKLMKNEPNV